MVRVLDILIESEAWLSRTGGIGGFSGSDIVLSGPTEGEDWDEQYQLQVATHSHSCTHTQNTAAIDTQVGQRLSSTTIAILTDNSTCFRSYFYPTVPPYVQLRQLRNFHRRM